MINEQILYKMLENISKSIYEQNKLNFVISDTDFKNTIDTLNHLGYIDGLTVSRGSKGDDFISAASPRVTSRGLSFMRQHENLNQ